MTIRSMLAALLLSACATTPPASNWSDLEGCWIDASDAVPPASMVWQADPDHIGALVGTWAVRYTSDTEDADIVTFTLVPTSEGMRYCEREPGAAEACTRAVLASQRARDGDVVFDISTDTLTFGHTDRPAPFFIGRRGGCA